MNSNHLLSSKEKRKRAGEGETYSEHRFLILVRE